MLPVLTLFLIPVGGGIPAGVLLARARGIPWPAAAGLYFVSDLILAVVFEPVLALLSALVRGVAPLARAAEAMREATRRNAARYGLGASPLTLVLVAFGVDPMTGRAAAKAAGHGFFSGWAIAITGDMMYYGVVAVATLKLSRVLGDPETTVAAVLAAMFFLPPLIGRAWKAARARGWLGRARGGTIKI